MKLSRTVILLLNSFTLTAALAGGVWWWLTWPESTARYFVWLVADRRYEDAPSDMLAFMALADVLDVATSEFDESNLHFEPRTFSDLLFSRREFRIHRVPYKFTAERSRIRFEWTEASE